MRELKLYQRISQGDPPDILLITRDANASSWTTVRAQVVKEINPRRASSAIVACPDPYIERWYLADPRSLEKALGAKIPSLKGRKTRDRYKIILGESLRSAGHPVVLGGIEFADDIVDAMDLYRAGKETPSLRSFLDDLRSRIKIKD